MIAAQEAAAISAEAAAISAKRRDDFINSDRGQSAIAIIHALVKNCAEAGGYFMGFDCDRQLSALYIAKTEVVIIADYLRSLGYVVVTTAAYLSLRWDDLEE